jgi:hypothetical protein
MKVGTRNGLLVMALLASAALPSSAQAQATATSAMGGQMDGQWHYTIAPYLFFPGISGEVSAGSLPAVPVDASVGDVLGNFDIGLAGHFEARKNRFGLLTDVSWNNLGSDLAQTQFGTFTADLRQVIAEGDLFYRVASGGSADRPASLDLIAGARYTGTKTRLKAEGSAGAEYAGDFTKTDWVDALAGLRFRAPLGSKFAVLGRGDVAGFGSNLTWNLESDLAFVASPRWSVGAGWRYMDIDYDNGNPGGEFESVQLAYSGPRAWFAYSW